MNGAGQSTIERSGNTQRLILGPYARCLSTETYYRVRVEQRNAQRAWSSPVWVRPT